MNFFIFIILNTLKIFLFYLKIFGFNFSYLVFLLSFSFLIYFALFELKVKIFPIFFYFLQFLYLSINFTYLSYFKIYLTPQTAISLFSEGLITFLKGSFPFYPYILLFLIDLPIFIFLIYKNNLKELIKFNKKIQVLSLSFCIIFLFFYFLINVSKVKERERIYEFTSDKRIVEKFGLTFYQINEIFKKKDYISKLKISENIIKREKKEKYSNIIFIQVESLDSFIISEKYKEGFVMPFLNGLKENSIYYPYVISYHYGGGTSDCEFTIFNSQEPIFDFPSINLLDYDYKNSFIKVLKKERYILKAFHGNEGYFWNRNYALPAMGFDKFLDIYQMDLKVTGWGAKDEEVFEFVLKEIEKEKVPFFYYIITMSSHVPFTNVLRHYKNEKFNDIENRVLRNYFLSMNYVDNVLEKYLKEFMSIPDTYIFIYGDHVGLQREENFLGSMIELDNLKFEFVPLLIITPDKKIYKEENLAGSFLDLAPTALSTSGIEFSYKSDGQNLIDFPVKDDNISPFEKKYKRSFLYEEIDKVLSNRNIKKKELDIEKKLEITKKKVEKYLTELYENLERAENFYRIRYGSTAIIVSIFNWQEKLIFVRIQALVLKELVENFEIYTYIANINRSCFYGKLNYFPKEKALIFEHFLLGEYLERDELDSVVLSLAIVADKIDDELKSKFGGKRFVDK